MVVIEQYYSVLRHMIDVNAFVNYHMIIFNDQFYQSLPADLQSVLDGCLTDLIGHIRETVGASVESSYTICAENGMEVVRLTPEERQVWINGCKKTDDTASSAFGADFISSVEKLLGK
jgi:TRAP-type C4-dicarboxylate transport system substrate-binding protein